MKEKPPQEQKRGITRCPECGKDYPHNHYIAKKLWQVKEESK